MAAMFYFLVEGYHYTRSVKNYALRLLVFGILSQIPFMLALKQTNLNMMFSLLLCLGVVWVAEHVKHKGEKMLLSVECVVIQGGLRAGECAHTFCMCLYRAGSIGSGYTVYV